LVINTYSAQGRDKSFCQPPPPPPQRPDRRLHIRLCELAKQAWKRPQNVGVCLSLIRELRVNINEVVCANGFTLFHFACISGSYELLAALLPAADLSLTTAHGDSPLYLAASAAAWLEKRSVGKNQ
jgi:hypothetical protein